MDYFFEEQLHGDIFWCNYETPLVNQTTAFVPYTNSNNPRIDQFVSNSGNVHKRKIDFLRRSWPATMKPREPERERGHRHMINERMRREREKQNYLALHSMLPPGTKNDKKSIIQTATNKIQELQCCKKELERRNYGLEAKMGKNYGMKKIRARVVNPISRVDSMVEVLKRLKKLDSRARSIKTEFTDKELTAVIDIETEIRDADVEKAVQR